MHGLENKTASEQLSSTGQLLKLIYQGYAGFGGLGEQASQPANSHLDDSIIPSTLRDRFLQIQRLSSLARFDSGESLCLTSRCQTSNRFRAGGHDAATCSRIQLTISGPASHNQTHSNCNSWYGHPEGVRHACEERNKTQNKLKAAPVCQCRGTFCQTTAFWSHSVGHGPNEPCRPTKPCTLGICNIISKLLGILPQWCTWHATLHLPV